MHTATVAILSVSELSQPHMAGRIQIALPRPDGAVCKVNLFASLLGDFVPTAGDEVEVEFAPGEDGRLWLSDVRRGGRSLIYIGARHPDC